LKARDLGILFTILYHAEALSSIVITLIHSWICN
jgi:hypothetical protein